MVGISRRPRLIILAVAAEIADCRLGDGGPSAGGRKRGNVVKSHLCALLMMAALLAPAALAPAAAAGTAPDPRVADLVRAGKIRVGLHLPQFIKDPDTGG